MEKKYIVRVISKGKATIFETKQEAHEYAQKVMQQEGLSVSIRELNSTQPFKDVTFTTNK